MNCPSCDAVMRPVGTRPHFHCPNCGAYHFSQETSDGVMPLGQPVGASCPVCRLPLQSAQIENETVCYCDRCRGFLAPMDAFGRIVTQRRARHGPHEQVTAQFDPTELQRELHCPDCDGRMDAHPYSGGGNAVVDTCEQCGLIWLDADELAVIERYVPHAIHIEPVHALPGAAPTSSATLLDILFSGPRRGFFPLDDFFR